MQTSALIVFKSASSVKKALKTAAEGKSLQFQFSEPVASFGLKGRLCQTHQSVCMIRLYSRGMLADWVETHKAKTPGNRELQGQLDEWMEQWEASDKERHETAAAAATDEGWTLVTKQRVSLSISHVN